MNKTIFIIMLLYIIIASHCHNRQDKIYNVLIKSREDGIKVYNFVDKKAAINFARQKPHEYCWYANYWMSEDFQEWIYDSKKDDGWILRIEFSLEGNYVIVSEGELK